MNRTDPGTHLPNRWPRLLFDACLHQVRGVKGSPAEVPEGVREDPLSRCSWKWVLTSDQGLPIGNAGWMFQMETQLEQRHKSLKIQAGVRMGGQNCKLSAIAARLLWVGQQ